MRCPSFPVYSIVFFLIACGMVCPTPVAAQGWLDQAIAPSERVHDFGTVARAANTEHRFLIKNPLDRPLHIRSVRASCGCTTPIVETEWIQPGEVGSILARFNTGTFTGKRGATLTVVFDQPSYAELQLRVSGYIRSDVVLFPGEANFGTIPEGEARTLHVQLDYAGRNDWEVVDFQSPVEFIRTGFEEVQRTNGRIKYRLHIELLSTAPAGLHQLHLLLHTNDRNLKTIPLRVIARVEAPIEISPKLLTLGKIKPGETVSQRLVLKGRTDFRVLSVEGRNVKVECPVTEVAKKVHLLRVELRPDPHVVHEDGPRGELLIHTDALDDPVKVDVVFEWEVASTEIAADDR